VICGRIDFDDAVSEGETVGMSRLIGINLDNAAVRRCL
jgi:hypothetical protein